MRLRTLLFALNLVPLVGQSAPVREDSVTALVQAVAELSPDCKVLNLPEGTYTIASMWTIAREGLTIPHAIPWRFQFGGDAG